MPTVTTNIFWSVLLLGLMLLPACEVNRPNAAPTPDQPVSLQTPFPALGDAPDAAIGSQGDVPLNNATIEAVDILLLESFPVQVNAVIKGTVPNTCAVVSQVNQGKSGNNFDIALATTLQGGAMCAELAQPFEKVVSLDVAGLPAGSYTVTASSANSVSNSFALTVDNSPPQAPPTPELIGASINGIVWDDSCRLNPDGTPAAGCAPYGNGFSGDGVFDISEARLSGISVQLWREACPPAGDPLQTTPTDGTGAYLFTNLPAGVYCVAIDARQPANAALLRAGTFSYPDIGVGSATVRLAENDYQTADFGWDFQFSAPLSEEAQPENCVNAALYVADVTIPDDTPLAAGEPFVKTWRVRNSGDCTWGNGYQLLFAEGNQMSGPAAVPLPQTVPPGNEVELSVSLVAPATPGTHRGDWLLQAPDGSTFGSNGDFAFYLQIVVTE
ncbi:MAG: hypothetical protein Kow0031_41380 [Anaerolineae bacterium]